VSARNCVAARRFALALLATWVATGGGGFARTGLTAQSASPIAAPPSQTVDAQKVLTQYCVTCHNQRLRTADLLLDSMDVGNVGQHAERWEQVVRKLRSGSMPPAGSPRPDRNAYRALIAALETSLDRAAADHPNPGRTTVQRLNRAEYANAIRDLLDLEIDSRSLFPADDTGYGFDNIADVLSLSPLLLERYLSAAGKISRLAVGDPTQAPVSQEYTAGKYVRQDDRRSEDLPFGSRGGLVVHHYFPADGEYLLKVYLDRTYQGNVRGLAEEQQLELRINGERLQTFAVGGATERDKQAPATRSATSPNDPKPPAASGRVRLTPEQIAERAADIVQQAQVSGQRAEQDHSADANLFVRFRAKAGPATVAVSFVGDDALHEGMRRPTLMITSYEYAGNTVGNPLVASIDIRGPYNATGRGDTPSRRRIFQCRPAGADDDGCATKIISRLARQAYRRPVTREDLAPLVEFFKEGQRGKDFDAGIQAAIERMLVSPSFLFRTIEPSAGAAPGAVFRIDDRALASRLSFFLWSSIPDERLLDLAARGKLSDRTVLEREVRRMLADRRASSLVSNFAGQWLMLRNLRLLTPDPYEFPDFDDNLREALQRETELFLESQIREDRRAVDLLTANYTFVNERLARHYGIPNVYGSHFRRVTLDGEERRGLLGQGSILTLTSYPNRTAPTIRGKFLLENILGTPPPPPPPNVPELQANATGAPPRTVRERLEQHRTNPVCASCHRNMDPLGFALENFDALGRYRTTDGTSPVDPTGVMPDGTRLDGPVTLRQALVADPSQFASTVTERLLTYALGRGVEYYDRPVVRRIVHESAAGGYRWSALILGIVESLPFGSATADGPTPERTAQHQ
jgi:mono/diheme cytochrome c family protein